jgi:hypothetical protein
MMQCDGASSALSDAIAVSQAIAKDLSFVHRTVMTDSMDERDDNQ